MHAMFVRYTIEEFGSHHHLTIKSTLNGKIFILKKSKMAATYQMLAFFKTSTKK